MKESLHYYSFIAVSRFEGKCPVYLIIEEKCGNISTFEAQVTLAQVKPGHSSEIQYMIQFPTTLVPTESSLFITEHHLDFSQS